MVRTLSSNVGGMGSIPGLGTKIPHTVGCYQKVKKKKTYAYPQFPSWALFLENTLCGSIIVFGKTELKWWTTPALDQGLKKNILGKLNVKYHWNELSFLAWSNCYGLNWVSSKSDIGTLTPQPMWCIGQRPLRRLLRPNEVLKAIFDPVKLVPVKKRKRGTPGGSVIKKFPASAGDMGSIPGPGRSHMLQSN